MRPCVDPSLRSHLHGFLRTGEIMTSVYPLQSRVIARLYPVLDRHHRRTEDVFPDFPPPFRQKTAVFQCRYHVQFFLVHAVRSCSYDYSDHLRVVQCFHIQGAQASNGGVSIRISLEIGQIMAGIPVSDTMEFNTLVHLPAQCLPGDAVTRMKCSIVTIGAASRTDSTVPVRASKACIEDYFLQPFSVFFPVITYK